MLHRRAKIVCTLGPASNTEEGIRGLIESGMDVARLNFSHGRVDEHRATLERVRAAARAAGRPVAVLQDLCGPKIRTGDFGPSAVASGSEIDLVSGNRGDETTVAVDYPGLERDVRVGDRVLLGDGAIELTVREIRGDRVRCSVEHGGPLRTRMGVNLPSRSLSLSALTPKDEQDVEIGLAMGVDYIGLSFVRAAVDVETLRALCARSGRPTPIVAKIETTQAVEQLESVVRVSDAIMVARGDLGVELPPESVPVIQRQIIGVCRRHKKPVIVATEMLQSMTESPRPTRAETSDVAGAVFGGADAVMLSAETATGRYPTRACRMMDRIIRQAETSQFFDPLPSDPDGTTPEAIATAACDIARQVGAKLIVALTESGTTARLVSKARPTVPIVAVSPSEATLSRLSLYWGVTPHPTDGLGSAQNFAEFIRKTGRILSASGVLKPGDRYVMVYGVSAGVPGATNALRVEEV
jgi:pyruvate kinase